MQRRRDKLRAAREPRLRGSLGGSRGYRWVDALKRGDLVTAALQGDQGKPRPALVVQSDPFADLAGVTVLPITSTLLDAPLLRVDVEPSVQNGLAVPGDR